MLMRRVCHKHKKKKGEKPLVLHINSMNSDWSLTEAGGSLKNKLFIERH